MGKPAIEVSNNTGDPLRVTIVDEAISSGTPSSSADITVDGTAGGVQLFAANTGRLQATIQNTGAANMRVRSGGDPTPTHGFQLSPGQAMTFSRPEAALLVKAIRETSTSTTAAVSEVVA